MKNIPINFDWLFCEKWDDAYIDVDAPEKDFVRVDIPHTVKELPLNNFDEAIYQFVSCYRKHFELGDDCVGKRLFLRFGAVANAAKVWVNGKFAVEHRGGYTAFCAEITDLVKRGDNVVTVQVDSTEREDIPPFGGVVDFLCYGGIYRGVSLRVTESAFVERLELTPDLDEMAVEACAYVNGANGGAVSFFATDKDGNVVGSAEADIVPTDRGDVARAVIRIADGKPWSVDSPVMYTIAATFGGESLCDRTGIRKCEFRKDGFFLNGEKLKLIGLDRHQSYPYVGYAMPSEAQEDDAIFLKRLGVNIVRTSHYPNDKAFLDKCDELGLLVFTEIPGWQFVSERKDWRDKCVDHVREMIEEDFNHPSIVLWGVRINESVDDDELYGRTNALAHKLDKSRQTGGVRCFARSHLLEDVYTFNDFVFDGKREAITPHRKVCSKDAPLLITEFAGHMFPTKSFDYEGKRTEHALRHATVLDAAFASKTHCGAIGWCMSDYNTHKDFGSGDKICYHGVSDMFRIPKLAAYVYMSQQDAEPVLEVSSNMEIGDTAGGVMGDIYIFTNCDEIRVYKNDVHVNTLNVADECKRSPYPHLPHPPIKFDDLIGNQVQRSKFGFSERDAKAVKKAVKTVKAHGTTAAVVKHMPTIAKCFFKYKFTGLDLYKLYASCFTGWGGKQNSYRFDGYKDGKLVVSVAKGTVYEKQLFAAADRNVLRPRDTYSVTRIELKMLSQLGNVLVYDNSVVNVSVQGPLSVIGPSQVALIGGRRAVWVRTTGKGKAKVVVSCEGQQDKIVEIDVE